MQGKNLLESGDGAGAVAALQKISDIDSNPDGLRDLLKAYPLTGQLSEAGAVASKLLTVHNDLSAIANFAEALMQAGQYENALQVYDQHAERLLAENSDKVLQSLHTIIGHVRENPDSLQKLLDLFNKAGENTHVSEVIELLAHASVQSGDLTRARDLYQKLAQVEPQNPLHMQNYQQVVSQLGERRAASLSLRKKPSFSSTIWKRPLLRFISTIPMKSPSPSARRSPMPSCSSPTTCRPGAGPAAHRPAAGPERSAPESALGGIAHTRRAFRRGCGLLPYVAEC